MVGLAEDEPTRLQLPEAIGQQVCRHTMEASEEVAIAGIAKEELSNDEEHPSVSDVIERTGEPAELAV